MKTVFSFNWRILWHASSIPACTILILWDNTAVHWLTSVTLITFWSVHTPLRHGRRGDVALLIHNLSNRCKWLISFTSRPLYPCKKRPDTHWIGAWVDPRACIEDLGVKKNHLSLSGVEKRFLARPTLSLVHRLGHPSSFLPQKGSCFVEFSTSETLIITTD